MLEVDLPSAPPTFALRELDGQRFDFDTLGVHAKWFEFRDETLARLVLPVTETPR